MNIKEIQDLILTMDKTSIENVDIENSEFKVSISKNNRVEVITGGGVSNQPREITSQVEAKAPTVTKELVAAPQVQEVAKEIVENPIDVFIVNSPIVGTYYDAASPDSAPFVKVGDHVKEGQTICIIEAMKIMNQIECEVAGEVYEILVKNEDVVEYNQPLIKIRR